MTITREHLLDFLTVQLLAELRASGDISDETASQAHADIRLLQDVAGPAIATNTLESVDGLVTAACLRLMSLAARGLLF